MNRVLPAAPNSNLPRPVMKFPNTVVPSRRIIPHTSIVIDELPLTPQKQLLPRSPFQGTPKALNFNS